MRTVSDKCKKIAGKQEFFGVTKVNRTQEYTCTSEYTAIEPKAARKKRNSFHFYAFVPLHVTVFAVFFCFVTFLSPFLSLRLSLLLPLPGVNKTEQLLCIMVCLFVCSPIDIDNIQRKKRKRNENRRKEMSSLCYYYR